MCSREGGQKEAFYYRGNGELPRPPHPICSFHLLTGASRPFAWSAGPSVPHYSLIHWKTLRAFQAAENRRFSHHETASPSRTTSFVSLTKTSHEFRLRFAGGSPQSSARHCTSDGRMGTITTQPTVRPRGARGSRTDPLASPSGARRRSRRRSPGRTRRRTPRGGSAEATRSRQPSP